jgi:hypothetical protein
MPGSGTIRYREVIFLLKNIIILLLHVLYQSCFSIFLKNCGIEQGY